MNTLQRHISESQISINCDGALQVKNQIGLAPRNRPGCSHSPFENGLQPVEVLSLKLRVILQQVEQDPIRPRTLQTHHIISNRRSLSANITDRPVQQNPPQIESLVMSK